MIPPVLEVRGICKTFLGVQALTNVSIELNVGEVLAVIGENGAGKSTLMKVLGGIHQPNAGDILYNGKKVTIDSVQSAIRLGIALIHQELNLAGNLDVASNVFLGREPRRLGRFVDRERLYEDTERILERIGLDCSPRTLVGELTIAQQQMVEIAKALSVNACVLIMDEPTSSLSEVETRNLFRVIKDLRAQGVSIIYVSHRLGEVKEVADRVSVLRDGENSGTLHGDEIDRGAMVKMMVGRNTEKFYHHIQRTFRKQPILEVNALRTTMYPAQEVSFTLHAGEILALAGLVGAGRTELLHTLFGIDRPVSGEVRIDGKPLRISSPRDAIREGMVLVPEDRRLHGLVLEMIVEENITLASLDACQRFSFIRRDAVRVKAEESIRQFNIRTPSIFQAVGLLSGGNQQKIVLAKWLLRNPRVLLLDEPTRGIDIVAKEEIYRLMEKLASEGVGILMASSEMQEVLGIADRILPMHDGRIRGELTEERFSEENVVTLTTGGQNN